MNTTDSSPFLSGTQHVDLLPEIVLQYDIPEDPDSIRWRAWWSDKVCFPAGCAAGIELACYPVIRKTKCGAWIDPYAYRQATKQPWEDGAPAMEWAPHIEGALRWVSDNSGQSWAKPTREEAVRSLAIRLSRHARNVQNSRDKIARRAAVLENLRPDLSDYAISARKLIEANL
jgi:hypothetical protein